MFTACLAVFAGALVWISLRIVLMEAERRESERNAQVQERVRLALWRMEAITSTMLIRENARPPSHYRAFYSPSDLYTSSNQPIPEGEAMTPSPLLGASPDLVRLHFEISDSLSAICSPQFPQGKDAQLASEWYVIQPGNTATEAELQKLEGILRTRPDLRKITAQTRQADGNVATASAPKEASTAPPNPEQTSSQDFANSREFQQRSNLIQQNIAVEKSEAIKILPKKLGTPQVKTDDRRQSKPSYSASVIERALTGSVSRRASTADVAPSVPPQELPAAAGDLSPSWIGEELFLFRDVKSDQQTRLQGVWLDWPAMRQRLLDAIEDLLPAASLRPATASERTDPDTLVTLPIKFDHGPISIALPRFDRPILRTLAIAWISLIAAAAAVAFVLQRALTLSERRGAFVSAVTHELRTPLTTFQLYSEMLADDMVKDPVRRKEYLDTLHSESGRLMHLVENVLSFSRIERGRTAAREETLATGDLLDRMLPRLKRRAAACDLELDVDQTPEASEALLKVDPLAVEQVLTNLVDNACKYAAPATREPRLDLQLMLTGREVQFSIRDYGPGIPKAQRKKLFQPFAKSASEAAHSAPGVGLGLALSQRLARELGGTLRLDPPPDGGARFVLSLPVARS